MSNGVRRRSLAPSGLRGAPVYGVGRVTSPCLRQLAAYRLSRFFQSYRIAYRQEVPVPRLRLSRDIRPLSELRANTAAFVRQVQESRQPLVLTQHGRSAAVLLGISEYERLLERAELLEDIRTAEAQLARGEGVPHTAAKEEVMRRLRR